MSEPDRAASTWDQLQALMCYIAPEPKALGLLNPAVRGRVAPLIGNRYCVPQRVIATQALMGSGVKGERSMTSTVGLAPEAHKL